MQCDFARRFGYCSNHYRSVPYDVLRTVEVEKDGQLSQITKIVPFKNPNIGRYSFEFSLSNMLAAGQFIDMSRPFVMPRSSFGVLDSIKSIEQSSDFAVVDSVLPEVVPSSVDASSVGSVQS